MFNNCFSYVYTGLIIIAMAPSNEAMGDG